MLKRDQGPKKLEQYPCCGKPYDPETQGRFKLPGTDTWLCVACYDKAKTAEDPDWPKWVAWVNGEGPMPERLKTKEEAPA